MRRFPLIVMSLTLVLAACSGGSHHPAASPPPAGTRAPSVAPTTTTTSRPRPRAPLSARIVLPSLTMAAGTSTSGRVVVENHTGHPIIAGGCLRLFSIALRNQRARQDPGQLDCAQRFTIPVGASSYPVNVNTSYSGCYAGPPVGELQTCLAGSRVPPLPPGGYHVVLVGSGAHFVPAPPPLIMHVTPT